MSISEKASSADNQQETHQGWGSSGDYTSDIVNEKLVALIAFLFTDGGISKHGLIVGEYFSPIHLFLLLKCLKVTRGYF